MQKFDVAIIGGGASGLACAVSLKKRNPSIRVVLIEAGERLGKKLAATGNGQGNLSNADMTSAHYHGSGFQLAEKLCCSGRYNPLELFDCLFVTDKSGRIYPAGKQASALSDCLIRKAEKSGVKAILSASVKRISKGFFIELSDGEKMCADYAVISAGGKAAKQFCTRGEGFKLAEDLGHKITALFPSLVQLKCDMRDIKTLKGIRAECGVSAYDGGELLCRTVGDVIFTDYGVSGNAIFYVSSYCAGREKVTLSLEFLPGRDINEIISDIARKECGGYPATELLSGTLHNQIGRAIIKRSGGGRENIARTVKNFTLKVEGSLGFDYAQVTKGGVDCSQISEKLESKLVKGLYFTGEVLDVDGDCGGYNLHWAFASGMCVAENIAKEYSKNYD